MNLWNRIEKAVGQGLDASREVLDKAREGAKDLSEKGVLKFDIMQLERQSMKVLSRLGQEVYDAFGVRNQTSVFARHRRGEGTGSRAWRHRAPHRREGKRAGRGLPATRRRPAPRTATAGRKIPVDRSRSGRHDRGGIAGL